MNTHGKLLKITTFGESHGNALGVVIDGFPANFEVDFDNIKAQLARRKPGQSKITTQRLENDEDFEVLSGIFEGRTTGHPITIVVHNKNQESKDYDNIKNIYRPNHADLTYSLKYGVRDHRGGGRSSGRETLSRVIAGALAQQYLKEKYNIDIYAYTKQVGNLIAKDIDFSSIENNIIRTADNNIADQMVAHIDSVRSEGNSIGGIIECQAVNIPAGLGEPVFGKIKARLAASMLSIGGVLGFEYGAGFGVTDLTGISYNQGFENNNGKIESESNNYGGVLGGITTGEDIVFRIAIKPTGSIYTKQKTVDSDGNQVDFQIHGRHDPCILPRVVPVIEAMTNLDILDLILINNSKK